MSTLADQAIVGWGKIVEEAWRVNKLLGLLTTTVFSPFYMCLVFIPALVIDILINAFTEK